MGPTYMGPSDDDLVDDRRVAAALDRREPTEVRTRIDLNAWSIATSVGASLLSAGLAVVLCLSVSARNAQRGISQRQQLKATAEDTRRALCALVVSLDDNALEAPPTTELGRSNAKTYASLRISQGCPPRERK